MLDDSLQAATRVSVVVVTYNSSDFILETLNSIRAQDYKHVELIITDDCSTDNTVELVRNWLAEPEHVAEFARYELVVNSINKGVAGNCNAGLKVCTGTWVKMIAGDDVLLPGCISTFVAATAKNPDAKLFYCGLKWFSDDVNNYTDTWPKVSMPGKLSIQLKQQLKGGFIKAPTVFMHRATLLEYKGFDERYPFLEDDPLWVKFLIGGHPFYYVPHKLIGYRMHENAISHAKGFVNLRFFDSVKRFKHDFVLPYMLQKKMFFWYYVIKWELQLQSDIVAQGNTRESMRLSQKIALKLILALRLASKLFNSIIT
jgi:glycosyltransferase involved in cell wall biosynthesis